MKLFSWVSLLFYLLINVNWHIERDCSVRLNNSWSNKCKKWNEFNKLINELINTAYYTHLKKLMHSLILKRNSSYTVKTIRLYMVSRRHKRLCGPFLVSKEDCMSCYSLVCVTILVICNIEVKQKRFSRSEKPPHRCSYVLKGCEKPVFDDTENFSAITN